MNLRLPHCRSAAICFVFTLYAAACTQNPFQAAPATGYDRDASAPTGIDAGAHQEPGANLPADAGVDGASPRDAQAPMDAAPQHDARVEPPKRDAQADPPRQDAASPNDAGTTHDASTTVDAGANPDANVTTPDAGEDASVPIDAGLPGRTDGCPDDAPLALTRARIVAAAGQGAALIGARIQGSNSGPTTDFVDLATITQAPNASGVIELVFTNTAMYRYIRYYSSSGQGGVAEIEFYHAHLRLHGAGFGTASVSGQNPYTNALDGDPNTVFNDTTNGGGYVGLDIARGFITAPVAFSPAGKNSDLPIDVTLAAAGAGVQIRYTTDGSNPSRTNGTLYTAPLRVGNGRTLIRALAISQCHFDSPITASTFTAGGATPIVNGLSSYHIGNSLTDTINPWLTPIVASTGIEHRYARWTIPGAPIAWLAEHQQTGFENPEGANSFDSFVQTFAPIDHISLQPYADPELESQGGAAVSLFGKALASNPEIQFWIYAQWAGQTEWTRDGFANGGGNVYPAWQVAHKPTNWQEATINHALYHEFFRSYVDERVGGKSILIVPGGLALVELKRQIDAGLVPGISQFFSTMFEDEIHLTARAQYLIALTFYACLYRQTPGGRVTHAGTGLTAEQAAIFQSIAWNVVTSYPLSGVAP